MSAADGTQFFDNGAQSGGNYWSNYTGIDVDGDGICDISYIIDDYKTDRYPLVKGSTDFVVPEVPFGSLASILVLFCAISVFVIINKRNQ